MLRSLVEFLLFVGFACGAGLWWLQRDFSTAIQQPIELGTDTAVYNVEPGDTFRDVAAALNDNGWWPHSSHYFLWQVRSRHMSNRLKAGEYELNSHMTIDQLIDRLVSGKTIQHPLTLVEGWTFAEMRKAIAKMPILKSTLSLELSDEQVMKELGWAGEHPEGRFFPDTYHVSRNTTDAEIYRRAHQRMADVLAAAWKDRAPDLPYKTPDEALILASIVEKETAVAAERPLIASVFVQRLKKGMKLQTDPTVIYGIGSNYDGNIRKKDLEKDTPYNTYTRAGLPPTPIAMPGREAIIAALHPADSDALYFVARGDGSHQFSRTLGEHNAAVSKFQLNGNRARASREREEISIP